MQSNKVATKIKKENIKSYGSTLLNNIGKEFLKLINKHFSPHHKLHKILKRNSIKISYSCLPNMKA